MWINENPPSTITFVVPKSGNSSNSRCGFHCVCNAWRLSDSFGSQSQYLSKLQVEVARQMSTKKMFAFSCFNYSSSFSYLWWFLDFISLFLHILMPSDGPTQWGVGQQFMCPLFCQDWSVDWQNVTLGSHDLCCKVSWSRGLELPLSRLTARWWPDDAHGTWPLTKAATEGQAPNGGGKQGGNDIYVANKTTDVRWHANILAPTFCCHSLLSLTIWSASYV